VRVYLIFLQINFRQGEVNNENALRF